MQLRVNSLLATDVPHDAWADLIETVRGILHKAWGLPVVCECIADTQTLCTGRCCGPVCKAMGVVMVRGV